MLTSAFTHKNTDSILLNFPHLLNKKSFQIVTFTADLSLEVTV
jgi:hypothetical protein